MTLICRTCSETKSRFFNIFNHYENGKSSSEILHECTSLEIRNGDLLPCHLCSECLARLVSAWCFRTMAIETDLKLRKAVGKQPGSVDKSKLECKDYGAAVVKEEANVKSEIQDPLHLENENVEDISLNDITRENTIFLTENLEPNLPKSVSNCNDKEILPATCIKQEPDLNIQSTDLRQLEYVEENSTLGNNQNKGIIINKEILNKSLLEYNIKNVDSISNSVVTKRDIVSKMLPTQEKCLKDTRNPQEIATLPLHTNYVQLAIIPTLPTQFYVLDDVSEKEKSKHIKVDEGDMQQETTAKQDSLEANQSENNDSNKVSSESDNNNGDEVNDEPSKVFSPEEYKKLSYVERKKLTVYCKLCNKNFKYRYYSEVHIRKHKGELPRKCDVCGKGFITTSQLKEHAAVHSETRPFECDICGKTFKMLPVLQNHRGIHSDDRPHKCNLCNLSFRLESYLKTHMKIHMNQKDYICEVCGKTFIDYRYLQSHLKFQHEVKNFLCTLCGKAYPTNSKLKWHLRYTHTNEKPYACVHCDKRFKDKNVMESHALIHTGEKPHSCKMCGRKFRQIVALRTHMRTHTGEAPYACKQCPSQFKYTQDLKKHMKVHDE